MFNYSVIQRLIERNWILIESSSVAFVSIANSKHRWLMLIADCAVMKSLSHRMKLKALIGNLVDRRTIKAEKLLIIELGSLRWNFTAVEASSQ